MTLVDILKKYRSEILMLGAPFDVGIVPEIDREIRTLLRDNKTLDNQMTKALRIKKLKLPTFRKGR